MDTSRHLKAVRRLGQEVLSRVMRAAAYLRQSRRETNSISHHRLYGDIIKDIDQDLGAVLSDTLSCIAQIQPALSGNQILEIRNGLQLQLARLCKIQLSGFNRLKHLAPTVELARFSRVIARQILYLQRPNKEANPQTVTPTDPHVHIIPVDSTAECLLLPPFHQRGSAALLDVPDQDQPPSFSEYLQQSSAKFKTCAISIPRTDSLNPLRWPSALHEVAHAICGDCISAEASILAEAKRYFKNEESLFFQYAIKRYHVGNWLVECWCDLFGAIAFGPAFWKAQSIALLQESATTTEQPSYPPRSFRLTLIWNMICARFPPHARKELEEEVSQVFEVFELLEENTCIGLKNCGDVRMLYTLFQRFFHEHFLSPASGDTPIPPLKKAYAELMAYLVTSNAETIDQICSELQNRNPIPTICSLTDGYTEKPVLVQELLVGMWRTVARFESDWIAALLDKHKQDPKAFSMGILYVCPDEHEENTPSRPVVECPKLRAFVAAYDTLDAVTLRSLQISEWAHVLQAKPPPSELVKTLNEASGTGRKPDGVLVDFEIYELLTSRKLKISPMIDWSQQLGSCSLDVRIGPTFESALPRLVGDHKHETYEPNVFTTTDLDLAEYFVIQPGQFVLGHTLEYFVFPDNVAAELEGRSSFARLGLEIHRTAGFIDNGFCGCITLELYNAGSVPIKLTPGERIGQLRLFRTTNPVRPYSKKANAKYGKRMTHGASLRTKDVESEMVKVFKR